uniref:Uncharacterized protein n=1 Tax=Molossus molossus TaxID=27622 RepID=A0A7J8GRR2_MOLMO|nr:hypothetical protein HJG59_011334 [Molossus molossus]
MGEWAEAEFPTTASPRRWWLKRKARILNWMTDWPGIAPGGKGGRLGGESSAVPPASGVGPCARLWSGARGEGAGGGRRRLSVLFARASSTLWVRRPAGAAGGVLPGPVRQPLFGAGSTGSLTLLEALGGVPGAEEDRRPPPKHEEGVKQEPPKISRFLSLLLKPS